MLKVWMHILISHTQSAFVPRCPITNNVLVVHELMHYLNQKKKVKHRFMSLKLDMSKAYDRVSWSFLKDILRKMGMAQKMIYSIMMCVTTVFFYSY